MDCDVFISYSTNDKLIAEKVSSLLERNKIPCWMAHRDILPHQIWAEAIIEAINQCRVMIVLFSSKSNDSKQVLREIERATSKDIPIITVRIENIMPSKAMEYFLGMSQWLDAYIPPLEQHLKKLVDTIQVIIKPEPSVDCIRIDLGEVDRNNIYYREFHLKNAGIGKLTGKIAASQPWLKARPNTISMERGRTKITATVNIPDLQPGGYSSESLNIETNGGNIEIPVTFNIKEPVILEKISTDLIDIKSTEKEKAIVQKKKLDKIICPKCHATNKINLTYCKKCGTQLTDDIKQCIACQSEIPWNALYCRTCGAKQ